MTANSAETGDAPEQPLIAHLLELRDRLLRVVLFVAVIFIGLFPFANEIYILVAEPLMSQLPEGTSMIATEVASPFLTPFKLSLLAAVFFAIPFILYQFWAFIAPALYKNERSLVFPLVVSSAFLFYLGVTFAYFVVFPLIFAFLTSVAPEGVAVMTDISHYLDFVITLFFAFGFAFEVPIATILVVWMGVVTPDELLSKRPYIIVGAFVIGMFLTPPDVISQTLLAFPMWILFEIGVFFSRSFVRDREDDEVAEMDSPGYKEAQAGAGSEPDEMSRELSSIEAEEKAAGEVMMYGKLKLVKVYRDVGDLASARKLLYEILENGTADQRNVAKNILDQLDTP
ncbi:MAG: twin-arginine translocase subunit TatC [Candidatus Polarisedimenticolaceae bacterium]|nr:twin-arginine translocase subunit TatC [Candidatus Polarisedimenticolaceae bacterium]